MICVGVYGTQRESLTLWLMEKAEKSILMPLIFKPNVGKGQRASVCLSVCLPLVHVSVFRRTPLSAL